ncbi:hypothetical protein EVAR_48075_1 [Eumeta japonica]|uniref:Secreted protein n=1 Tax=Eumeta variegata TaxID=151549 RepID=A0A4C1X9R1_EUMVA|nr:hypothetical protein EVAR_48075_1 [Eumeta japonica]
MTHRRSRCTLLVPSTLILASVELCSVARYRGREDSVERAIAVSWLKNSARGLMFGRLLLTTAKTLGKCFLTEVIRLLLLQQISHFNTFSSRMAIKGRNSTLTHRQRSSFKDGYCVFLRPTQASAGRLAPPEAAPGVKYARWEGRRCSGARGS